MRTIIIILISALPLLAAGQEFRTVTKWLDGTKMDDSRLYPGWFIREGKEYKQRAFPYGKIDAAEIGFDNTGTLPNDKVWKKLNNYLPSTYALNIAFPSGIYLFDSTIVLKDRQWFVDAYGATFMFPPGKKGLIYTMGGTGLHDAIFRGLTIAARGQVADFTDSNNNATAKYNGITVESPSQWIDCSSYGFSGHKWVVYGAVNDRTNGPSGTNVSMCNFYHCRAAGGKGHGMWLVGPDANQISIIQFDARDLGGYGIDNWSFLGNYIEAPHTNNCAMGPYRERNPTNASLYIMPYSEEGMPRSVFVDRTQTIGGLQGSNFTGGQAWDTYQADGLMVDNIGGLRIREGNITYGNPVTSNAFFMQTNRDDLQGWYTQGVNRITNAIKWHNGRYDENNFAIYTGKSMIDGKPAGVRGIYAPNLKIGKTTFYSGELNDITSMPGVTFNIGDRVFAPSGTEYRCTAPGTNKQLTLHADANGGTIEFGKEGVPVVVGEYLTVNGKSYQATQAAGKTGFYTVPPFAEKGVATYAVAKWEAVGNGASTAALPVAMTPPVTLSAALNGSTIILSGGTIFIPADLPEGFKCAVINTENSPVTFQPANGVKVSQVSFSKAKKTLEWIGKNSYFVD